MFALYAAAFNHSCRRDFAAAISRTDELIALADEKGALYWKTLGTALRGWLFAATGNASDAVRMVTSGITSLRATGATLNEPWYLSSLAIAYAELCQVDDAWRCVDDVIDKVERSNERWCEAEVHRIAGEIALKSREQEVPKAEAYFESRARGRTSTANQILGTACSNEHGAALARSGQARRGPRPARSGLRLVH
jgi:predicted ATPase